MSMHQIRGSNYGNNQNGQLFLIQPQLFPDLLSMPAEGVLPFIGSGDQPS